MIEIGIKGRQDTTVTSANVATNVGSGPLSRFLGAGAFCEKGGEKEAPEEGGAGEGEGTDMPASSQRCTMVNICTVIPRGATYRGRCAISEKRLMAKTREGRLPNLPGRRGAVRPNI